MGTLLPREGHEKPPYKQNCCHQRRLELPSSARHGGGGSVHLRSRTGHSLGRKDFKSITCVSILSKDIDEDVRIGPRTDDITGIHLDFILVTWK